MGARFSSTGGGDGDAKREEKSKEVDSDKTDTAKPAENEVDAKVLTEDEKIDADRIKPCPKCQERLCEPGFRVISIVPANSVPTSFNVPNDMMVECPMCKFKFYVIIKVELTQWASIPEKR